MMAPRACRILVADDQPYVLEALRMLLRSEGFDVTTTGSPSGLLAAVEGQDYDAVLMDLNYARDTTSGREGLDLLQRIQGLDGLLPVVVMTAWGSVESAVEAMRRGGAGFAAKPCGNPARRAPLRTHSEQGPD